MDSARPGNPQKYLTLKQTAEKLAVSVDTLLEWNGLEVLTPSITPDGEIVYTEDQINHFLEIKKTQNILNKTQTSLEQPGQAVVHDASQDDCSRRPLAHRTGHTCTCRDEVTRPCAVPNSVHKRALSKSDLGHS